MFSRKVWEVCGVHGYYSDKCAVNRQIFGKIAMITQFFLTRSMCMRNMKLKLGTN